MRNAHLIPGPAGRLDLSYNNRSEGSRPFDEEFNERLGNFAFVNNERFMVR